MARPFSPALRDQYEHVLAEPREYGHVFEKSPQDVGRQVVPHTHFPNIREVYCSDQCQAQCDFSRRPGQT
jgi:hypothetical protein